MSTVTMPESKSAVARELAANHYALEPGMKRIFRLLKPGEGEGDWDEPLKLLEVNEATVKGGIQPVHFGAYVADDKWYPPVILVVVTPEEYKLLQAGKLELPHGWRIGGKLPRAAS
ncbi:MAG: hypothetical protein M5U26_15190 [Planctomycetota bacterium]|nr:hypothetical protein [Planctomycetota bacterium]